MTVLHVDGEAPVGSIVINNGADSTQSRIISLAVAAADEAGVALMRLRNEGAAYGPWASLATSLQWTLSGESGTKAVFVQFQDTLGNISAEYSDTIEYAEPAALRIGEASCSGRTLQPSRWRARSSQASGRTAASCT